MDDFKFMLLPMMSPLLTAVSFVPIVLYITARWRAHRDPVADPQLGLKFVTYYFASVGLQLLLVGGTLLIYAMIRPGAEDQGGELVREAISDSKNQYYRVAFGFIVPAGIVLAAHVALLARTNDELFPGVKRLFYGFNLLVTGLAGFTALVCGIQALFHKGSTGGFGHFGGAAIVVYCAAWALLAWRYDYIVRGPTDFTHPPEIVTPSPPPAATTGSGLPPLGEGAFPPIEPPR